MCDNAFEGLMKATPLKRYKSFLNTVADREEVWLLASEDGCATYDADGHIHVLVWPMREFCEVFMSADENPIAIEIHHFMEKCREIDSAIRFMVFPTFSDTYIVTKEQLCSDIEEHLAELE